MGQFSMEISWATGSVLGGNQQNKIPKDLKARFEKLLVDDKYRNAIFFNTSDASVVKERLALAEKYLMS